MSMSVPGEPRIQDVIDAAKTSTKCRIPQRLPPARCKPPFITNPTRPKYSEPVQSRPKSANKVKEDLFVGRVSHPIPRFPRTDRNYSISKRPIPKTTINERTAVLTKIARPLIVVPFRQRLPMKHHHTMKNTPAGLPDQETIKKHEELELRQSAISDATHIFTDSGEKESISSPDDKLMQLKISWQSEIVQYERMKNELTDQQKAILELYAVMCSTHQKMLSFGEKANLPAAEDLCIMNVTKMTPEQLLQLCSETNSNRQKQDAKFLCKKTFDFDVNKLYNMPSKLVDTCEQTLLKRKEVIDWFDTLKSHDKGISVQKLSKKINEFTSENEMLKCSLDQVKAEFIKELEEIVLFLRNGVNETIALQLRNEELTCELCQQNSKNADLRKQMHNAEHLRSQTNKTRVEELQKELKEEKCKRICQHERLSRAEAQLKMNSDKASQLEAALEQAQSQTWSLERTVQQLHDQNQKMQNNFDKELITLNDSIKEHTFNLEEIANAREKLQTEKKDLEKRLKEIAEHYNESLKNAKHEVNINVVKLIETEKKCCQEAQEKNKLQSTVESLCAQLMETDKRLKDAIKKIQEMQNEIDNTANTQEMLKTTANELDATKKELNEAKLEITDYKNRLAKQTEMIVEIKRDYKESKNFIQSVTTDLSNKDEYIAELEKKQSIMEQQLQENESKLEAYVEQLSSLKSHITQLQKDFGEFENLDELHDKVNHQRAQLLEATRQNGELAEALQRKEEELEQLSTSLTDQERSNKQRDGIIKMLSDKEQEQTNIIKLLRNNLELRSRADSNLNQQLAEKMGEIESLMSNIEMTKQQISNLEEIILTLQDQTRRSSVQRKKDQDKIAMLQSKLAEYEAYHMESDAPTENLDHLIKIIEDELGTPMDPQIDSKGYEFAMSKNKYAGNRKREKTDFEEMKSPYYHPESGNYPAKIIMGNFVKKTYIPIPTNDNDNLDRKKAITNIDTQKWIGTPDPGGINMFNSPATRDTNMPNSNVLVQHLKTETPYLSRNLPLMASDQHKGDKKYKMFKIAGHRL